MGVSAMATRARPEREFPARPRLARGLETPLGFRRGRGRRQTRARRPRAVDDARATRHLRSLMARRRFPLGSTALSDGALRLNTPSALRDADDFGRGIPRPRPRSSCACAFLPPAHRNASGFGRELLWSRPWSSYARPPPLLFLAVGESGVVSRSRLADAPEPVVPRHRVAFVFGLADAPGIAVSHSTHSRHRCDPSAHHGGWRCARYRTSLVTTYF